MSKLTPLLRQAANAFSNRLPRLRHASDEDTHSAVATRARTPLQKHSARLLHAAAQPVETLADDTETHQRATETTLCETNAPDAMRAMSSKTTT